MNHPLHTRLIWDIPNKIENSRSGGFHMAADDYLAETISEGSFEAILRFYTWSPPGISLGLHQAENAVNMDICRLFGWDVVSRPTGGRTLLHNNDLSYSVVLKSTDNSITLLRHLYGSIAKALISALSQFGIEATDTQQASVKPLRNSLLHEAKLCAGSCVRGEVTVDGLKISSAAQRVYRKSILQHGSIPIKGEIENIVGIVPIQDDRVAELKTLIKERAAALDKFCIDCPTPTELALSFSSALQEEFNFELNSVQWSKSDLDSIQFRRAQFEKINASRKAS